MDTFIKLYNKYPRAFSYLIITTILYIIYNAPIHTIYYFADENINIFAKNISYEWDFKRFIYNGMVHGRPIMMYLLTLISDFAHNDNSHLQIIRILQLLISSLTAFYLFRLIIKRNIPHAWGIAIVIFIWAQPTFQIFHTYSATLPALMAMSLSLLSFQLTYNTFEHQGKPKKLYLLIAFLLLMVCWIIYQSAPFVGLSVMAIYALTEPADRWKTRLKIYLSYIAILIISMITFTALYKYGLSLTTMKAYPLTNNAFSLLTDGSLSNYLQLLHPKNYTGPFELWNYLFPIKSLSSTQNGIGSGSFLYFAYFAMIVYAGMLITNLNLDIKLHGKKCALQRHVIATSAVLLTFLPLVADGFSFRQHIYMACTPAIILTASFYFLTIYRHLIKKETHRTAVKTSLIVGLVFVSFGAQANIMRGILLPSVRYHTFLINELLSQKGKPYNHALVINAKASCEWEPCRGFMFRRLSIAARDKSIIYQLMLNRAHMRYEVPIVFSDNIPEGLNIDNYLIIDYRKLASLQQIEKP